MVSTRRHQNRHDPPVESSRVPRFRPTFRSLAYVVAVALVATVGFTQESPWPILFAALLALPASIVAVPSYYVVYGVLALIPGANPSSNTGFETVDADGRTITSVITGTPAAWFTITTHVLGILALTVAALLNVLVLRAITARRRGSHARALVGPGESPHLPPVG